MTGLQKLLGPLGWKPAHVTAGAAAEVTVAGAASGRLPRDRADIGAAANTVAGASGRSRTLKDSSPKAQAIEVPQAQRGYF